MFFSARMKTRLQGRGQNLARYREQMKMNSLLKHSHLTVLSLKMLARGTTSGLRRLESEDRSVIFILPGCRHRGSLQRSRLCLQLLITTGRELDTG